MSEIKCKNCNKTLNKNGLHQIPCPILCYGCGKYVCIRCGGSMYKNSGCPDLDNYTAGKCENCNYKCCGRCV